MITIIDYGMGNLRSVQKACERLGYEARISSRAEEIAAAEKLILPGVGAFRDAISHLKEQEFVEPIKTHIDAGKPLLGICLGLQLLFDRSYEDGEYEGLGIVPGEVVRFPPQPGLKVPHMGWNKLQMKQESPLMAGIPEEAHFYFVHSYYVVPEQSEAIAATCEHGVEFCAMIQRENLFATQFHPEKSQRVGLKLLDNFGKL
ncbi:MAG: imidazole glycerol phosphate synthase subunit HisH [Planctomycetaceae bacterium]|nr:imidazole glycerol phosphate synthase subunit HisH [Planctomycetaceae bacterium]